MSVQIKSRVISRRKALLLVGLAGSLAVPATVLTASDAEAQQPGTQTPKKKKKKKAPPSQGMAPQTGQGAAEKPKAQ
jgi:hypothetical protein